MFGVLLVASLNVITGVLLMVWVCVVVMLDLFIVFGLGLLAV